MISRHLWGHVMLMGGTLACGHPPLSPLVHHTWALHSRWAQQLLQLSTLEVTELPPAGQVTWRQAGGLWKWCSYLCLTCGHVCLCLKHSMWCLLRTIPAVGHILSYLQLQLCPGYTWYILYLVTEGEHLGSYEEGHVCRSFSSLDIWGMSSFVWFLSHDQFVTVFFSGGHIWVLLESCLRSGT
jgi:hypothetical protein